MNNKIVYKLLKLESYVKKNPNCDLTKFKHFDLKKIAFLYKFNNLPEEFSKPTKYIPKENKRLNTIIKILSSKVYDNKKLLKLYSNMSKKELTFYKKLKKGDFRFTLNLINNPPKFMPICNSTYIDLPFPSIGIPNLDGINLKIIIKKDRNLCNVISDDNCYFNTVFKNVLDKLHAISNFEFEIDVIAFEKSYEYTIRLLYDMIDGRFYKNQQLNFHLVDIHLYKDITYTKRRKILQKIIPKIYNLDVNIGIIPEIPVATINDIYKGYISNTKKFNLIIIDPNSYYTYNKNNCKLSILESKIVRAKVKKVIIKKEKTVKTIFVLERNKKEFFIERKEGVNHTLDNLSKFKGKTAVIIKINNFPKIIRFEGV